MMDQTSAESTKATKTQCKKMPSRAASRSNLLRLNKKSFYMNKLNNMVQQTGMVLISAWNL